MPLTAIFRNLLLILFLGPTVWIWKIKKSIFEPLGWSKRWAVEKPKITFFWITFSVMWFKCWFSQAKWVQEGYNFWSLPSSIYLDQGIIHKLRFCTKTLREPKFSRQPCTVQIWAFDLIIWSIIKVVWISSGLCWRLNCGPVF